MPYVLTTKTKFGETRHYNKPHDDHSWYDCDSVESAHKFQTKEAADAMCIRLNAIIRENGWYGTYRVKPANQN